MWVASTSCASRPCRNGSSSLYHKYCITSCPFPLSNPLSTQVDVPPLQGGEVVPLSRFEEWDPRRTDTHCFLDVHNLVTSGQLICDFLGWEWVRCSWNQLCEQTSEWCLELLGLFWRLLRLKDVTAKRNLRSTLGMVDTVGAPQMLQVKNGFMVSISCSCSIRRNGDLMLREVDVPTGFLDLCSSIISN
jgi:hypothetical protein